MAHRTPLAQYVLDCLLERGETVRAFTDRVHINESGFYKFLRGEYLEPRQGTLGKIADGLGMTTAELLVAADPAVEDPDLAANVGRFKAALRDVPHAFRVAVVEASIRLAKAMPSTPLTSPGEGRLTDPVTAGNEGETEPSPHLPTLQPVFGRHLIAAAI